MQCVNKYLLCDDVFLMIKIVLQHVEVATEIVYSYTSLMIVLYFIPIYELVCNTFSVGKTYVKLWTYLSSFLYTLSSVIRIP